MDMDPSAQDDEPLSLKQRIARFEQSTSASAASSSPTVRVMAQTDDSDVTSSSILTRQCSSDEAPRNQASVTASTTSREGSTSARASPSIPVNGTQKTNTTQELISSSGSQGARRPKFGFDPSTSRQAMAMSLATSSSSAEQDQQHSSNTASQTEARGSPDPSQVVSEDRPSSSSASRPPPPIPRRPVGSSATVAASPVSNTKRPQFGTVSAPTRSATMSSASSNTSTDSSQTAPRLPPRRSSTNPPTLANAGISNTSPALPPRPNRSTVTAVNAAPTSPVANSKPVPPSVTPVSPVSYARYTPGSRRQTSNTSDSRSSLAASSLVAAKDSNASSPSHSGRSTPTSFVRGGNVKNGVVRPIDPRARKRYDQVFDQCRMKDPNRPLWIKDSGTDKVDGFVVRQVWLRSRLDETTLSKIWDACDVEATGSLHRQDFDQGMWMIDEELRRRRRGIVV
ncbi:hypothetical protein OIO90_000131 [Microbotryomycetes sp. JL221]|nr:hypothetical protein OIO90_000131 [Microbotryomycetes sp. JL221]